MQLQAALVKIVCGVSLSMAFTLSHALLTCDSVSSDNENYIDNMQSLAIQARLPDNYFNRYHEDVVSDICKGDEESIDDAIDYGYVKRSEVEGIRESLGLDNRSSMGTSYEYSRQRFYDLGLSSAKADNVAQFYTKEPNSQCGKLAKHALEGNPRSIAELQTSPDYCTWDYKD